MADILDLAGIKAIAEEQDRDNTQQLVSATLEDLAVMNQQRNIKSAIVLVIDRDGHTHTFLSRDPCDTTLMVGALEIAKVDLMHGRYREDAADERPE